MDQTKRIVDSKQGFRVPEEEIPPDEEIIEEVLDHPAFGYTIEVDQNVVSNDMSQTFSIIIGRVTRRPAFRIK